MPICQLNSYMCDNFKIISIHSKAKAKQYII